MKPFAVVTGATGGAVAALCCLGWAPLLGVLGAAGLGFLLHDAFLLPALAGFLALAAWGAIRPSPGHGLDERTGDSPGTDG